MTYGQSALTTLSLDSQPHGLQISWFGSCDGEIRRLWDVVLLEDFPVRPVDGFSHGGQEFRALEPLFLHLTGERYADLHWL